MQQPGEPGLFGGVPQAESLIWSRLPLGPLRPDPDCEGIPLSDTPGAYTSTVHLMTGFQGSRRLNWIQKHWTHLEHPTFLREFDFYRMILNKVHLPCVPTLLQAWSTADGYYLGMEPPHHVGWHCATNTLGKEAKQDILKAYTLLELYGILHGFTRLDDILIGDDGKVTIVNFTAASAVRPGAGMISSYEEKDYEAERCRLLAALNAECSTSSQAIRPRRFEIPAYMRAYGFGNSKGGSSGKSREYQHPSPLCGSKPPYTTTKESRVQTVFYATQRGFISKTLPPQIPPKKKVRFEYGTMDSHLWNHAKEYGNGASLWSVAKDMHLANRKATQDAQQKSDTRPDYAPSQVRSSPPAFKPSKTSSASEPAVQSSSSTLLSQSTSSTSIATEQATLGIPLSNAQRRRPLGSSNACSDGAGPSLTYEEPPPSCNNTRPDESEELDEELAIVITSPTGQQHVWGAPSNILSSITQFLGNIGARRSTPVYQAVPTARKRKAENDEGDSDPEPVAQREETAEVSPAAVQEIPAAGRQLNGRDSRKTEQKTQLYTPSPRAQTSLAARTGETISSVKRSALKRKAEPDDSDDTRKVRGKS
ncbi:hypothetical protein PsYK624_037420 [Phanerochaete sordida]|uniref:Uncharacterized protein n=1 Tax=Phanerochaete sordida TaxID=48140 RepID=A0A9P3G4F4_9APHY|nr:hypothetical protein PsYK624_037420 [Phanerochaete sordida]